MYLIFNSYSPHFVSKVRVIVFTMKFLSNSSPFINSQHIFIINSQTKTNKNNIMKPHMETNNTSNQ